MKILNLIKILECIREKHGDVNVSVCNEDELLSAVEFNIIYQETYVKDEIWCALLLEIPKEKKQ